MMKRLILRNHAIRWISLATIVIGIAFPLANIYLIYPQFSNLLVSNTEDYALRLGRHLTDMYFHDNEEISPEDIRRIEQSGRHILKHFDLMKIKVFGPLGRTLFSTDRSDIGLLNEHDNFRSVIADGRPYAKTVKKDTPSLDGQVVKMDVVETYVPIMRGGRFIGAFEIYYDISNRSAALNQVMRSASLSPIAAMIIFVSLISGILLRLDREILWQQRTRDKLRNYAEQLSQSNHELESFAHIASHDLNEPLRKITAFGSRLREKYADALGEQGRDYLTRMENAAKRMQNLINGLLMYSRVTTKANPFVQVDLNAMVREVLSDLEVRIQESKGIVEIGELPTLSADPLQMRQLLQNLISNALKFRREGVSPVIRIRSSCTGGNGPRPAGGGCVGVYQLAIEDNGIGFDEKYSRRIFDVFQRLHGQNEYEGSGIGLSVCKRIAERHGGNITVKSAPDKGATFIITLPVNHKNGGQHEHEGAVHHDPDGR